MHTSIGLTATAELCKNSNLLIGINRRRTVGRHHCLGHGTRDHAFVRGIRIHHWRYGLQPLQVAILKDAPGSRHVPCSLGSPREQLAFVVCRVLLMHGLTDDTNRSSVPLYSCAVWAIR